MFQKVFDVFRMLMVSSWLVIFVVVLLTVLAISFLSRRRRRT